MHPSLHQHHRAAEEYICHIGIRLLKPLLLVASTTTAAATASSKLSVVLLFVYIYFFYSPIAIDALPVKHIHLITVPALIYMCSNSHILVQKASAHRYL